MANIHVCCCDCSKVTKVQEDNDVAEEVTEAVVPVVEGNVEDLMDIASKLREKKIELMTKMFNLGRIDYYFIKIEDIDWTKVTDNGIFYFCDQLIANLDFNWLKLDGKSKKILNAIISQVDSPAVVKEVKEIYQFINHS